MARWPTYAVTVLGAMAALATILQFVETSKRLPGWIAVLTAIPSQVLLAIMGLAVLAVLWIGMKRLDGLEKAIKDGAQGLDGASRREKDVLTFLGARLEDGTKNPALQFPMKLRAVLRNDSNDVLQVFAPTWKPGPSGVQAQERFMAKVQTDPGGANELDVVQVPAGRQISMWLSLDPRLSQRDFDDYLRRGHLGTLVFLVKQGERDFTQEVRV